MKLHQYLIGIALEYQPDSEICLCRGSDFCKQGSIRATCVVLGGLVLCNRCYEEFEEDWFRQQLPKQKHNLQDEIEKHIFASWHDPALDALRLSIEYEQWRKTVLQRDGYKCKQCGNASIKLHAHHKKSFRLFPKLRFIPENGLTLCEKCHKKLHIRNFNRWKVLCLYYQTKKNKIAL